LVSGTEDGVRTEPYGEPDGRHSGADPAGAVTAVLAVRDLTVRFGGVTALDGVSFAVPAGQVCGLIGPNGAGKTTLFDCVSRLTRPRAGSIELAGRDLLALQPHQVAALGVARTFQHLGLVSSLSVRDNVMLGAAGGRPGAGAGFAASALRLPRVRAAERALRRGADEVLDRLGLAALAGHPAAGLPYGTLKRVELARALAARPTLLLLDEPASGLAHGEVDELAGLIQDVRGDTAVLLVEHHMGMVMRLSDAVVVLDFGRVIAAGTPAEAREDPAVLEAYLGTAVAGGQP
jgi:branched-chain amino acid transport system ATP-binding protein